MEYGKTVGFGQGSRKNTVGSRVPTHGGRYTADELAAAEASIERTGSLPNRRMRRHMKQWERAGRPK